MPWRRCAGSVAAPANWAMPVCCPEPGSARDVAVQHGDVAGDVCCCGVAFGYDVGVAGELLAPNRMKYCRELKVSGHTGEKCGKL